jgi:hypothetical protein
VQLRCAWYSLIPFLSILGEYLGSRRGDFVEKAHFDDWRLLVRMLCHEMVMVQEMQRTLVARNELCC